PFRTSRASTSRVNLAFAAKTLWSSPPTVPHRSLRPASKCRSRNRWEHSAEPERAREALEAGKDPRGLVVMLGPAAGLPHALEKLCLPYCANAREPLLPSLLFLLIPLHFPQFFLPPSPVLS